MNKSMAKKITLGITGVLVVTLGLFGITTALQHFAPQYQNQDLIQVPSVKEVLAGKLEATTADVNIPTVNVSSIQDSGYRIRTKATFADAAKTPEDFTLEQLYKPKTEVEVLEKLLFVQELLSTVYDVGDSQYFITYLSAPDANSMNCDSAIDAVFYRDNDNAVPVDGVICDKENGIAFIPKTIFEDYKAEEIDRGPIQAQLLFRYTYTDAAATMQVPVEISTEKGQHSTFNATVDSFTSATTIKVVEGENIDKIKPENIKVSINDEAYGVIPAKLFSTEEMSKEADKALEQEIEDIKNGAQLDEEELEETGGSIDASSVQNMVPIYNPEDGTVSVPMSAANIMNIRVDIDTENTPVTLASTQVSLFSASGYEIQGFNSAHTNAVGRVFSTSGRYLDASGHIYSSLVPNGGSGWGAYEGTKFKAPAGYRFQIGPASGVYAIDGSGCLVNGGGLWRDKEWGRIEDVEGGNNGWKTACWDAAAATDVVGDFGWHGSQSNANWIFGLKQGYNTVKATNVMEKVYAKVLAQSSDTITFAFVCPNIGKTGQAAGMITTFAYQSKTDVKLAKSIDKPSFMTTNPAHYNLSGAVYGIYRDWNCTSYVTQATTNASGQLQFPPIDARAEAYYVKEITAPAGCYLDTRVYPLYASGSSASMQVSDQANFVRFTIKKTTTDSESIQNPYYNFNGIQYRIEGIDNTFKKDVTLTDNSKTSEYAKTAVIEVPFGKYRVYEIATNEWYKINTTPQVLDLTESAMIAAKKMPQAKGKNIATAVPSYEALFSDDPVKVKIDLIKNTTNSSITDVAKTYSRNGAEYVLENIRCGATAKGHGDVLTTARVGNQDGYVITRELLYDDWKIYEKTASESFALDTNVYTVTERNLENKTPHQVAQHGQTPKIFHMNSDLEGAVFAAERPQWVLYDIQKQDLYSSANKPEEKATLENAVFEIKYYDNYNYQGTPLRTWYVATDKNGYATIQNIVAGDMTKTTKQDRRIITRTYKSDEPFRDPAGTGKVVIPTGSFEVQEVLNPEGYLYDNGSIWGPGNVYRHVVRGNNKSAEQHWKPIPTEIVQEEVYRADIQLTKVNDDDQTRMDGIPFVIEAQDSGEWHVFITDENGYFTSKSSYTAHGDNTANLNKNDKYVEKKAEGHFVVKDYSSISYNNGIFFRGFGPKNDPDGTHAAAMKFEDAVEALPYGEYKLYELACEKNYERSLRTLEWSIQRDAQILTDGVSNMGTINDASVTMMSTAVDKTTGAHQGDAGQETVTIADTVAYTGLEKSETYTVVGTLMDKGTGEKLIDGMGNTFESVIYPYIPADREGTVNVEFNVPGSVLSGKTVVVFEDIIDTKRQATSHRDIEDLRQTVDFAGLKTTATDDITKGHEGSLVTDMVKIHDKVEYNGLQKDIRYSLIGTLMDKATGQPIIDDGTAVTSSIVFQPSNPNGDVTLTFEVSPQAVAGKSVVVFEDLYRQDRLVTTHRNLRDADQTVHYPSIDTIATDSFSQSHIALANEKVTVVDRVYYNSLIKDGTYSITGVLMDKITGKPLKDKDGKEYTATREFVAGVDYDAQDIQTKVDKYKATLSEIDKLLKAYKEKNGKDWTPSDDILNEIKKEEKEYNDIAYREWKIAIVEAATKAPDNIELSQEKLALAGDVNNVSLGAGTTTDEVKPLTELEATEETKTDTNVEETEYEEGYIKKVFMYKPSELIPYLVSALRDVAPTRPFSMLAIEEFYQSLKQDEKQTIGEIPSSREIENAIKQLTSVAQEEARIKQLQENAVVGFVGTEDFNGQCVEVKDETGNWYFASAYIKGDKAKREYTDVVYKNGKFMFAIHTLNGTTPMVDYEDINGQDIRIVPLEDYGRWDKYSADGRINGHVALEFTVPQEVAMGATIVVFEKLSYDEDGDGILSVVANHEDINDEDQTVRYSNVVTTATVNGQHDTLAAPDTIIIDKVDYVGLQIGQEYVVKGVLMDKLTNTPIVDLNGQLVTASTTFKAEKDKGSVNVEFNFDASILVKPEDHHFQDIVVFEKIYSVASEATENETESSNIAIDTGVDSLVALKATDDEGILTQVGAHEDINDLAQTIRIHNTDVADEPIDELPLPLAGDIVIYLLFGGVIVAGVIAGAYIGYRRKRF